jgi:hypothetical protein
MGLEPRVIGGQGEPVGSPAHAGIAPFRLLPEGRPEGEYVDRFLADFGVRRGEIELYRDVTGEHLAIGEALFTDRRGQLKAAKRGRERHLLLIADTIRDPDEIWMALDDASGKPRLRRRYVARWHIEGDPMPTLAVFEWSKDQWSGVTALSAEDVAYLERRGRVGERVYRRRP